MSVKSFHDTSSGTATASDIVSGKTAYGADGKVTGIATATPVSSYPYYDAAPRTLVEWQAPVGSNIEPYTVTTDDFAVLHPDATLTGGLTSALDSSGYIYGTGGDTYDTFTQINNLPARTAQERIYEMRGKTISPHVNEAGIHILFNLADGNNWWEFRLYWYSSTYLRGYLYEYTAGVGNFRGTAANLSSAVTGPAQWFIRLHDGGDWVKVFYGAHKTDSNTVLDVRSIYWTAVGRPNQSATKVLFGQSGHVSNFRTSGVRVRDQVA
jgi:hypothetical protein